MRELNAFVGSGPPEAVWVNNAKPRSMEQVQQSTVHGGKRIADVCQASAAVRASSEDVMSAQEIVAKKRRTSGSRDCKCTFKTVGFNCTCLNNVRLLAILSG